MSLENQVTEQRILGIHRQGIVFKWDSVNESNHFYGNLVADNREGYRTLLQGTQTKNLFYGQRVSIRQENRVDLEGDDQLGGFYVSEDFELDFSQDKIGEYVEILDSAFNKIDASPTKIVLHSPPSNSNDPLDSYFPLIVRPVTNFDRRISWGFNGGYPNTLFEYKMPNSDITLVGNLSQVFHERFVESLKRWKNDGLTVIEVPMELKKGLRNPRKVISLTEQIASRWPN